MNDLHAVPHLPQTSFVGRDYEAAIISRLLADSRLVTLIGPGGVGKTRLAVHLCDALSPRFPDGIQFIDMSTWHPAEASVAALIGTLVERRKLLVLDTCDVSLQSARELVDRILDVRGGSIVLATSRIPLGLRDEQLYRVPALASPLITDTLERIRVRESVQLFVERQKSLQPVFQLTATNARTVAKICDTLDGLPLALELASEQAALLGLESFAQAVAVTDVTQVVPTTPRPRRQLSLQDNFSWTLNVLLPVDRHLLSQLTVFSDGFTLEAAEYVCGRPGGDPADLLDSLERLVRASCVELDPDSDRYRLPNIVRALASPMLGPGERLQLHDRLVAWLHCLASTLDPFSISPALSEPVTREMGNLRSVFSSASSYTSDRRLAALRLYVACKPLWLSQWPREGDEFLRIVGQWFELAVDPLLRAQVGCLASWFVLTRGQPHTAIQLLTDAIGWLDETHHVVDMLMARYILGEAYRRAGNAGEACTLLTTVWQASLGQVSASGVLARLALAQLDHGDTRAAAASASRAMDEAQHTGTAWSLARAHEAIGMLAAHRNDSEQAVLALQRSVQYARAACEFGGWIQPGLALAEVYVGMSDREHAGPILLELLDAAAQFGEGYLEQLSGLVARSAQPIAPEFLRTANPPELAAELRAILERSVTGQSAHTGKRTTLTRRELEVARLVGHGLTNRQIARELSLSEATVRAHVGHVLEKLEIRSRVQVTRRLQELSSA